MEINEDEPDDVKKATPVESAILDGYKDEKKQRINKEKPKSAPTTFNDNEEPAKRKRCNLYKEKFPSPVAKVKKPCHPKKEIICRDNLSKDEYIDVLSTPKKSRGLSCKPVRKFEPNDSSNGRFASGRKSSCKEKNALPRFVSQRLEELAKPKPSHVMDLLETWGSRLRPEIIDSVQKSLEENCAMSPEQMEAYYNDKEREKCSRTVRRVRRKKCPTENERKKLPCDDGMDRQTVCEEYEMAQRFMRHIISHLKNCRFAPDDHYDLTEVILSQLGNVLDYRPSGDGDRKFQMMFMLANGIGCWVHGLNVKVAEKIARQQAEDAKEEIETEESEDEDNEEEERDDEIVEATEEEEEEEEEEKKKEIKEEDENEVKEEQEAEVNEEEQELEPEENFQVKSEPIEDETTQEIEYDVEGGNEIEAEVKEEEDEMNNNGETDVEMESETEEIKEENELEDEKQEPPEEWDEMKPVEEVSEMEESEIEVEKEAEEYTEDEIQPEDEETVEDIDSIHSTVELPGLAIQELGEGDLFASEIPFVTFGKIMETVVKFLEKFEEAETTEVRRRLQNAILKKLRNLILAEAPDSLDDQMMVVLEILAENIAVFMEDTLPKREIKNVETMTPVIESTEVRNWGHWLETVMDNATNWGKWIHEKVGEAEEKARTKVKRGDWQDWTRDVNSEALRWRMFNLDTKHRMHHADLNLTHKKVVHRGGMRTENVMGNARLAPYQEKDETEINAHDLSEEVDESHDPDEEEEEEEEVT